MPNKRHLIVFLTTMLLLGPVIEKGLWRNAARQLADSLDAIEHPPDTLEMLTQRAFPFYKTLTLARQKLLQDPRSSRVAIANSEQSVRQRMSEILYPVIIDEDAPLAIAIDMKTGTLQVTPIPASSDKSLRVPSRNNTGALVQ